MSLPRLRLVGRRAVSVYQHFMAAGGSIVRRTGAGWGAVRAAEIPGNAKNKALHDLLQRDGLCRPTSISFVNSVV